MKRFLMTAPHTPPHPLSLRLLLGLSGLFLCLPAAATITARMQTCYAQAQTQYDINTCSQDAARNTRNELQALFQAVLAKYRDDPHQQARLRAAQRAWTRYRDAEFAAVYPHAGEANYATAYAATCTARLNLALMRARIARLRLWLRGGIEGDLCAGALRAGGPRHPVRCPHRRRAPAQAPSQSRGLRKTS